MQFAKDSFFLALQQRLAGLNPARTVTINGTTVMSLDCVISNYTLGTVQSMVDRGRVLGQLDGELLEICQPTNTEKYNYTQSPSADLGTSVFWNQPGFQQATTSGVEDNTLAYQARGVRRAMYAQAYQDGRAERRAKLTIFFFAEATLL